MIVLFSTSCAGKVPVMKCSLDQIQIKYFSFLGGILLINVFFWGIALLTTLVKLPFGVVIYPPDGSLEFEVVFLKCEFISSHKIISS